MCNFWPSTTCCHTSYFPLLATPVTLCHVWQSGFNILSYTSDQSMVTFLTY